MHATRKTLFRCALPLISASRLRQISPTAQRCLPKSGTEDTLDRDKAETDVGLFTMFHGYDVAIRQIGANCAEQRQWSAHPRQPQFQPLRSHLDPYDRGAQE